MTADMSWVADASCFDHPSLPPTAWLEPPKFGHTPPEVAAVCAACPALRKCDAYADENEEWGIWAGKSHLERYGRNPRHLASTVRGPRKPYRKRGEVSA